MSEQVANGSGYPGVSPHRTQAPGHPDTQRQQAWTQAAWNRLSPREQEILALLSARWTDREIADALYISYRTVTTHVSNIYDKLGIHSRREAAAFAMAVSPNAIPVPSWPGTTPQERPA